MEKEIVKEFGQNYLAEYRWVKDRPSNLSAEDWLENALKEYKKYLQREFLERKGLEIGIIHNQAAKQTREEIFEIIKKEKETWAEQSIGWKAVESVELALQGK